MAFRNAPHAGHLMASGLGGCRPAGQSGRCPKPLIGSPGAKVIKLADKIANLRDIIAHPPATWSDERKREYFDWASRVVQGIRGTNSQLEATFDSLYSPDERKAGP